MSRSFKRRGPRLHAPSSLFSLLPWAGPCVAADTAKASAPRASRHDQEEEETTGQNALSRSDIGPSARMGGSDSLVQIGPRLRACAIATCQHVRRRIAHRLQAKRHVRGCAPLGVPHMAMEG